MSRTPRSATSLRNGIRYQNVNTYLSTLAREYVKGDSKEPGDHTKEELREMYHKNLKPNADK